MDAQARARIKKIIHDTQGRLEQSFADADELTKHANLASKSLIAEARAMADKAMKTGDTSGINGLLDKVTKNAKNAARSNK